MSIPVCSLTAPELSPQRVRVATITSGETDFLAPNTPARFPSLVRIALDPAYLFFFKSVSLGLLFCVLSACVLALPIAAAAYAAHGFVENIAPPTPSGRIEG